MGLAYNSDVSDRGLAIKMAGEFIGDGVSEARRNSDNAKLGEDSIMRGESKGGGRE